MLDGKAYLAQALRAIEGYDQGDAGLSVVGSGPLGAHRARRLSAVYAAAAVNGPTTRAVIAALDPAIPSRWRKKCVARKMAPRVKPRWRQDKHISCPDAVQRERSEAVRRCSGTFAKPAGDTRDGAVLKHPQRSTSNHAAETVAPRQHRFGRMRGTGYP